MLLRFGGGLLLFIYIDYRYLREYVFMCRFPVEHKTRFHKTVNSLSVRPITDYSIAPFIYRWYAVLHV